MELEKRTGVGMGRRLVIGLALLFASLAVPSFAVGTFGVTNVPVGNFHQLANMDNVTLLAGDFNGDGYTDMALTGSSQWTMLPVAFSRGDGTFNVTTDSSPSFAGYAATSGARPLVGDFNGDHMANIALIGPPGWSFVPIAFSLGNGSFNTTYYSSTLTGWSSNNYAPTALVGDLNHDGRDDIALTGPGAWSWIPVGFSYGDGTFNVTTQSNVFASYTAWANAKPLIGDFNNDGKADLAAIGPTGWGSLPVAFSNGDGTFNTINVAISGFAAWAASPNVKIFTGDFNHDKKTDVALTGVSGWGSLPVALSNGDGSFAVQNAALPDFPAWAADPSARILAGDFNGDKNTDVALSGPGWGSMPVAFSYGDGTFGRTNQPIVDFGGWAASGTPVVGDFNGDGKADVTLKGPSDWVYIPTAFSLTPKNF